MVQLNLIPLKKSINKAYLKIKPIREDFHNFKNELQRLLSLIDDEKSEEHNKNFIRDFLINTFYAEKYVNTEEKADLVIHLEKSSKSLVGVIIEVKNPTNKADMISGDNLNCKAIHEVILYYLRQRIEKRNDEIKNIIITNAYEWFIFKAEQFEKLFYRSSLKSEYEKWRDDKKVSSLNEHFYSEIVKKFLAETDSEIEAVYFDIRDFEKYLGKENEKNIIPLFKKLSPPELLKEPFANDSNTLNKQFYSELLHIIGLEEYKEGSKKKIGRKDTEKRDKGSLFENTIRMLKSKDVLKNFDDITAYGSTEAEQLYNISLELNIIWINRILFLKLLEAQLVNYHEGDKNYKFLEPKVISRYDDLFELFHEVLAVKTNERNSDLLGKFNKIPYLNSSLFELSDIEKKTIDISSLKNRFNLPFYKNTIFGKKLKSKDELTALEYLLHFLDSFDFASEGGEEILEERKTIINASVLGLIFEKINGYKEGSFYTPGFITMYMARETLRRAVVQKFNEAKGKASKDYEELKRNIDTSSNGREEANKIINDLKICDPGVGSGHFLVSGLNEIIAIKADLNILNYRDGRKVQNYCFEIENDELVITNEETDELFNYHLNPYGKPITALQDLQEALFHEKETIIENCLFGVDINPNSVNICRLRLWIELLKNAYYTKESNYTELETLPNIDINIKQGNSLISRFDVKQDIFTHADKQTLDVYKINVALYKNEQDKNKRRELKDSIEKTKERFRGIAIDPLYKVREQREKLTEQLHMLNLDNPLFKHEDSAEKDVEVEKKRNNLIAKINKLSKEIEDKSEEYRSIYSGSFEWRFEFPEVLDDEGNYKGFDVVIGNPPYVGIEDISWDLRRFYETVFKTATGRFDLYSLFIEKAIQIKTHAGGFIFILPGKFLNNKQFVIARKIICDDHWVTVVKIDNKVFDEAQVDSTIIENYLLNLSEKPKYKTFRITSEQLESISETDVETILQNKEIIFRLEINTKFSNLISKIEENTLRVIEIGDVKDGIISGLLKDVLFLKEKKNDTCRPLYFGKHLSMYSLIETNLWVDYRPDFMLQEELRRKKGGAPGLRMRNKGVFEREKILTRFVAKEVIATYDNEDKYYEHTLHGTHISDKRFRTKYVLALFNSKLFRFYYQTTNSQGGDIFPQVRISSIENLPIKLADAKTQKEIEIIVDRILKQKKQNPKADTTELEKEIDEMVYKIYGLTEEEIRIVEGS